ncbi:CNTNAP5 [Branchiostoma lanceolatum]|uniref:CNTNAP5 protein n=1 Tax=Branchiostoma lanceolatum TaxID=7740 RepID=A0A8K0ED33_BRALA|nr:CNTNAP5 [Branchiostoma lanceolatum]
MSTEKLTIDNDGHYNHRRGHGQGPITSASLVQVLTACMSVIIIVLVIQEGVRVAFQGREMIEELSALKSAVSDYQEKVSDHEKEVAAMKAQQEVNTETLEAKRAGDDINLQSEPGKTRLASVAKSYADTESADVTWQAGPAHRLRQKRAAANSVTWPAEAGACLQGPPGRDGRDGRDCPFGAKDAEIDELQRKYQELRQRDDVLEQRVSVLENKTETTPIPCSGDTCDVPSIASCSEVVTRSGFNNQAFYVIDPDGPDRGVLPMTVQCDVVGGTATTLIGHNSEARTHVDGIESFGTYSKDVTYWDSMEQVRAVVDQSTLCKQQIKYECHGSLIWDGNGRPYAWWVTWDGRQADYWGGASPGSGKCACGQSGTCSGRCNCDANDFTWREDSGFLSHKDDLPVTQLRFGDTGHSREEGYHTLGKLICYP